MPPPVWYGRFDPVSFGIRLNLEAPAVLPIDQERLYLTLMSYNLSSRVLQSKYLTKLQDEEEVQHALLLFTSSMHETRHFHDLLAAPYGAMLARCFSRLALQCIICYPELVRSNAIVLPLRRWVSDWRQYREISAAVRCPSEVIRTLSSEIDRQLTYINSVDTGIVTAGSDHVYPNATSIIEGLATLAQEKAVLKHFGHKYLERSRNAFRAGFESGGGYYAAINFVRRAFHGRISSDSISLILFASLCGIFDNTDRVTCPTDLLVDMLGWLEEHEPLMWDDPAPQDLGCCINQYFRHAYGGDLRYVASRVGDFNSRHATKLSELVLAMDQRDHIWADTARSAVQQFRDFCNVHAALLSNVIEDPSAYVSDAYISEQINLPSPVIYIESDNGFPHSDGLEKIMEVHTGSLVDLGKLAEICPAVADKLAPTQSSGRLAWVHRMTPRFPEIDKATTKLFGQRGSRIPEIDRALWYANHTDVFLLVRGVIYGLGGMLEADKGQIAGEFGALGTAVFGDGYKLYGRLGDDGVDKKETFRDFVSGGGGDEKPGSEALRSFLRQLRAAKDTGELGNQGK